MDSQPLSQVLQHVLVSLVEYKQVYRIHLKVGPFEQVVDATGNHPKREIKNLLTVHEEVVPASDVAAFVLALNGCLFCSRLSHPAGWHDKMLRSATVGSVDERAYRLMSRRFDRRDQGCCAGIAKQRSNLSVAIMDEFTIGVARKQQYFVGLARFNKAFGKSKPGDKSRTA
jgi:hypothetical protein